MVNCFGPGQSWSGINSFRTMAYYLVKCKTRGGLVQGVTMLDEPDIDKAWSILEWRAVKYYGSALIDFACYGLARRSVEVLKWKTRGGSWKDEKKRG